jgi:molecular chaperone GrpE
MWKRKSQTPKDSNRNGDSPPGESGDQSMSDDVNTQAPENEADRIPDAAEPVENGQAPGSTDDPYDKAIAERDELMDKYQRVLADFSNFKRRSLNNEEFARRQGRRDVIQSVLPALDNLDRALMLEAETEVGQRMHEGITIVRDEILQALETNGCRKLEPNVGDEFDPGMHEALMEVDAPELGSRAVAQLFQVGYAMGELILRSAKVSVSKCLEDEESDSSCEDAGDGRAAETGNDTTAE